MAGPHFSLLLCLLSMNREDPTLESQKPTQTRLQFLQQPPVPARPEAHALVFYSGLISSVQLQYGHLLIC